MTLQQNAGRISTDGRRKASQGLAGCNYVMLVPPNCGPGSSVGIATGYGLDGPGIESRWVARFSAPVQTGPGAHTASCTMGSGSFPGIKSGRGVTLTPHPFYCRGQERIKLYFYFPYGQYGLYRASVPVQGCTLPLPSNHTQAAEYTPRSPHCRFRRSQEFFTI